MKKISLWVFILMVTVSFARAQDAAAQQQIDKLAGQIQDVLEAQAQQGKRLDALEKQVGELRDKVNTPAINNSASADDLKSLAAQVQEVDKKRVEDNEKILKEIEKLGKVSAAPISHRSTASTTATTTTSTGDNSTATPAGPQKGYEYPIKEGDTLSAIAKAYRAQGVKVTTAQIIAANPKMNPNSLIAGKKIFIPDANAK